MNSSYPGKVVTGLNPIAKRHESTFLLSISSTFIGKYKRE